MDDHYPAYTKRSIGKTPIRPQRTIYGFSVRCSCGWTRKTNEDRTFVEKLFKEHLRGTA